jgi:hypothetical protein
MAKFSHKIKGQLHAGKEEVWVGENVLSIICTSSLLLEHTDSVTLKGDKSGADFFSIATASYLCCKKRIFAKVIIIMY